MDILAMLARGALAGLGVAMPLGAIGVLLLGEGISRGFRRGAPAAVAVGVIDTLYSAAAVLFGAVAAPVIGGWGSWPAVIGGGVLVGIATLGLWRLAARPAADGPAPEPAGSGWQRFVLFLGLTAVNPATLVYFAAITVGLTGRLGTTATASAFVIGVGLASVSWQLVVVGTGAILRHRITERARRLSVLAGNLVVAGLGVAMLVGALR